MKRLLSCLFLLPVLSSCIAQEAYYEAGYYAPPSYVKTHRHGYYHRHHSRAVPVPRAHVERHSSSVQVNRYGSDRTVPVKSRLNQEHHQH